MKSKGGAVLIGFVHSGLDNANRVIDELEKCGIKKGDLVAREESRANVEFITNLIEEGKVGRILNAIDTKVAETGERMREKGANQEELVARKLELQSVKQDLIFQVEIQKFFISKKVRFLPLESRAMARKMTDLSHDHITLLGKGKRDKKKKD
ncbi:MAG: hypothetical protein CL943_00600 [Candidatus Diapherotrites archaeon]|uniref:Uncharacterized protein n=1 Tax=Candidatus Iainarchaeum sp. TaxID=3101447 RepID=A0A2D6M054_9ARCH|nr:hypothetical protein [Candidatus Diapherotrites archaeon]|tara:strand:+ start:1550 stop:2008 length:459 start_codon:yes stop_codon:yes gene_type:complete